MVVLTTTMLPTHHSLTHLYDGGVEGRGLVTQGIEVHAAVLKGYFCMTTAAIYFMGSEHPASLQ